MDGEKLERKERDFWESKRETRERKSESAGRHNKWVNANYIFSCYL